MQVAAILREKGLPVQAYVGFQHTPPLIAEAVRALIEDGVEHAIALVMTPYYSRLSVEPYFAEVGRALADTPQGVTVHPIPHWYHAPGFLDLMAARVHSTIEQAGWSDQAEEGFRHNHLYLIFTAHSLPARVRRLDDPYIAQFQATAARLAARVEATQWSTCYQSASQTGEPWLKPDILDALDQVASLGAHRVVVCPTSFAADNLEVLYDIGIEAKRHAEKLGMQYTYVSPFNALPAFAAMLAHVVLVRYREVIG